MTTMKDFLRELTRNRNWCAGNVIPLISKPVEDIYAGTQHPGFWCVVLYATNPSAAKGVLEAALHDVAGALDAGDMKTNLLAFSASMDGAAADALMTWASPLRKGSGLFGGLPDIDGQQLATILFDACKVIKYDRPELMMKPISALVGYKARTEGLGMQAATAAFYDFLHGEVDLATWKGGYE
jgi:hypothetical protein